MQKRRDIEDRTLQSSERSLGLLYESERAGIATAEELDRQKETLKKTEERLDDINSTLKTSERHLQVCVIYNNIFNGMTVITDKTTTTLTLQLYLLFYISRESKVFLEESKITLTREMRLQQQL